MKKLIAMLICLGLISNSMMLAFNARKIWTCRPTSKDASCTEKDRTISRNIILGSSVVLALLLAALAALKIKVSYDDLKKEQAVAIQSVPVANIPQATNEAALRAQKAQAEAEAMMQQRKSSQEQTVKMLNEAKADLAEINTSIAEWKAQQATIKSAAQAKMVQDEIKKLEDQKKELESQISDLENMLKS